MMIGDNLIKSFENKFENSIVKKANFKFNQNILEFSLIVSNTVTSSTNSISGHIQQSTSEILSAIDHLKQNLNNFNETIMLLTTPLQTGQTPMLMICQIPLHFF
jgi:hypothetical protein